MQRTWQRLISQRNVVGMKQKGLDTRRRQTTKGVNKNGKISDIYYRALSIYLLLSCSYRAINPYAISTIFFVSSFPAYCFLCPPLSVPLASRVPHFIETSWRGSMCDREMEREREWKVESVDKQISLVGSFASQPQTELA